MLAMRIHPPVGDNNPDRIYAWYTADTVWITGNDDYGNEATLFLTPMQALAIRDKLNEWLESQAQIAKEDSCSA